jgi:hypothetical protein
MFISIWLDFAADVILWVSYVRSTIWLQSGNNLLLFISVWLKSVGEVHLGLCVGYH